MEQKQDFKKNILSWLLIRISSSFFLKILGLIFYFLIVNFLSKQDSDLFFEASSILSIIPAFLSVGFLFSILKFFPIYFLKRQFNLIKLNILIILSIFFILWLGSYFLIHSISFLPNIFQQSISFFDKIFSTNLSNFFISQKSLSSKEIGLSAFYDLIWLATLFTLFGSFFNSILLSFKKFFETTYLDILAQLIKLVFILILIFIGIKSSFYFFGAYVASLFLILLISAYLVFSFLSKYKTKEKISFNLSSIFKNLKEQIYFGFPFYLSSVLNPLISQFDVLFIAYFLQSEPGAVTAYVVVSLFAKNISPVILAPISSVQLPVLVEENEKKSDKFFRLAKLSTKLGFFIGIIVLAFFLVFGHLLLELYSPAYASYSYLFWFFIPVVLADLLSFSQRNMFFAKGNSKILFLFSLSALLLNAFFDILLIPLIGIGGAALASSIAFILPSFIIIQISKKHSGSILDKDILYSLLLGIFVLLIFLLAFNYLNLDLLSLSKLQKLLILILGGALFSLLYFIFLILFRLIKLADIILLIEILAQNKKLSFLAPFIINIIKKFAKIFNLPLQ